MERLQAAAVVAGEGQAHAMLALGHALYQAGKSQEAIMWWEKAIRVERTLGAAWRNLGVAYFNVYTDVPAAKGAFQRAIQMDPSNPCIIYERDQLWKRAGELPQQRLEALESHLELVKQRDDATVSYCVLLNQMQRYEEARQILRMRKFQPWEDGSEFSPLGQWRRTHVALGRKALWRGDAVEARQLFEAGLEMPRNFGEIKQLTAYPTELHYWEAMACHRMGDGQGQKLHLEQAVSLGSDFGDARVCANPEIPYFSALAADVLNRGGYKIFESMRRIADGPAAPSAPAKSIAAPLRLLQFDEDERHLRAARVKLLEALACWGLGDRKAARRMIGDMLRDDPNHSIAADLMISIDWE